jgi:hypothetical protein
MMAENPEMIDGQRIRRERKRTESLKIDKAAVADRIKGFYDSDMQDRGPEIAARIQRYAKYRMWTEGKDWPWEGATDSCIPDMMTACSRMEDTLHNAVMSSRPPIMAKARHKPDVDKEETVTGVVDYQFFEEQRGEEIIGTIANDFVTEGLFTLYTPWVHETRRVREVKDYAPLPAGARPVDHFLTILEGFFPKAVIEPAGDGWDWKITDGEKRAKASFYTKHDDRLELELEREVERFNGPRAIRKDLQDVLHPARCDNLQIPGPSNENGATHVIIRDFPTIDEIRRLASKDETGRVYYDLLDDEHREKLGVTRMDTSHQEREEQKDAFQGHTEQRDKPKGAESHNQLTRLMCFDCYDIDGDGLDEDVVFWMILETKTLLKVKYLSEVFPATIPQRPFAEGHLFPVPGRRLSIGMLELMEGIHDLTKQFFDQGGDAGTLGNAPFGFYRAASNMRQETIRMMPGEMYPLSDPQRDVHFPQLGNPNQAFMFNMLSVLNTWGEKVSSIGDLQMGRVPQGKASALRTVSGMQTVLAQGEARPERVLRRFFIGLAQVFQNFHALNEQLLPAKKRFMLLGPNVDPNKEVYGEVGDRSQIRGPFRFTFSANALNTSKEALQGALQDVMGVVFQPLMIQLGMAKPDGMYRLARDYIRARGPDPDKYLSPPTPGAMEPPINAEEAIMLIMQGAMPKGSPMEGTAEHFEKLTVFMQSDEFGYMDEAYAPLFRAYLEQVRVLMAQEQTQQALLAAAQQMGDSMGTPGLPGPAGSGAVDTSAPPVQGGELVDETLPGAGGGGNTEFQS